MSERILIIDDSLTVRMDLDAALKAAGYTTSLCATAAEARAALVAELPAVAVLDVLLPDADGVELLSEIRESPRTAGMPVILLSTEAEVKDRIRGLSQGADEYVGKPYDSGYVVARVASLLRQRSGGGSVPAVLVIDDSLTFREELAALLRQAGYNVLLSASGDEGLRRAADARPDAIIVDGVMPGLDGPSVVRRIRLDPGLCATPCLLLTASEGAASEVVALDAGADAYVRKNEGAEVILARIGATIRSARESLDRVYKASLLGPKRILAVDDSATYLEELGERLREDGYEVVRARSGEEALDLLTVEQVDCILLDLLMPGLSGTETCSRIKGSPVLRRIPLILLTALDEQDAMIEGINAGADDYVAKSANFDALKARMRAQLRRKQFEDENRRVRDQLLRKDAEADSARKIAEARQALLDELSMKNAALSAQTTELERINAELRMFAYSVSHDLRQPLRSMDSFSKLLLEQCAGALDERGSHYLDRIRAGAQRMGELIDGILALSRVSQRELEVRTIRLDQLAQRVLARLREAEPSRVVDTRIQPALSVEADAALMESVLENLLGNAWKFTSRVAAGEIEFAATRDEGETVYYVRDNGAGFDMTYADKLFGPFQRLHSLGDFAGTGIGLATVQRVVHRHGGRIWAESAPGNGATFFFTIHSPGGANGSI
jgi:DNA-binding response OmpR family regulator